MSDLTNHGENIAAQALDGSLYAALHTSDPGETGATGELSGDGYTREAVTMTTSSDTVSNSGDITWGPVTADKVYCDSHQCLGRRVFGQLSL